MEANALEEDSAEIDILSLTQKLSHQKPLFALERTNASQSNAQTIRRGFTLASASSAYGLDFQDSDDGGFGIDARPVKSLSSIRALKQMIQQGRPFGLGAANAYLNLLHSLDAIQDEVASEIDLDKTYLGSTIVMSTGLSIGYVVWLLRGGMLLSTLLSSLPAWQILDPLPILSRKGDESETDDDESLESILKQKQRAREPKQNHRQDSAMRRPPKIVCQTSGSERGLGRAAELYRQK